MTKFIQLSDLHIRSKKSAHENIALDRIVRGLLEKHSNQPPVVILTGDIVNDGKKSQYKRVIELLKPLVDAGFKLLACPGNHDYGPGGNIYTEKAQHNFQKFILRDLLNHSKADVPTNIMEKLYPLVYETSDAVFVGLDSVEALENSPLHFAAGKVGSEQLSTLKKDLNSIAPDKARIVYFHHHPFYRATGLQMTDAQEVLQAMEGKVDMLCFGHKHVPEIWQGRQEIKWILAADKTTRLQPTQTYDYSCVEIIDRNRFVIMKECISFK